MNTTTLANGIQSEFKPHYINGSLYHSLYVNGEKTNVYYAEIEHYLNPNSKREAIETKKLIDTLQIYPTSGTYKGFDICCTYFANFSDIKEVDISPAFNNTISNISGVTINAHKKIEVLNKLRENIAEFTQWTKRIHREDFSLLNKVGVKFYDYGYTIFFY